MYALELIEMLMNLANLKGRDREIIKYRLSGMPLSDVGNIYGVTRERIRQLEMNATEEMLKIIEKE
jgi:DNA-directed RNA polymerase sigma subunit (sigma70/sigma32)